MDTLQTILRGRRVNDRRGIHKTLRQIDMKVLALALFDLTAEERNPIWKNMTLRSREIVEEEFTLIEESKQYVATREKLSGEQARDLLAELLLTNTIDQADTETVYPAQLPRVDLSSCAAIKQTFEHIARHAYKHGLGSLEGLEEDSENELFQKGMQLLLDGYEPLLFEQLLENYKAGLVQRYQRQLTLIIEGMKSLQMGWPSAVIKEKLLSLSLE